MDSYQPGPGDHYRIDTPERLDLDYDVASLGSRLLAALVDTVLVTVLYALLLVLGGFALAATGGFIAEAVKASGIPLDADQISTAAIALIFLFTFGVFWGYYLFFEMVWHGQSPGKRWVGLRVIREGGYPVGFAESAIRNLVRLVDFLPFYYGLGALVMFIDRRSRRLGDLAAGTLVVKERREIRLESLSSGARPEATNSPGQAAEDPLPNLHILSASDHSLVREYLSRRPTLSEAAASRLARQLAETFAGRLGHDLAGESPDAFLARLARQLNARG